VQGAVSTVFKGTPLDAPAQASMQCFIKGKVDTLKNATASTSRCHASMRPRTQLLLLHWVMARTGMGLMGA
jgi:hypothetical protein